VPRICQCEVDRLLKGIAEITAKTPLEVLCEVDTCIVTSRNSVASNYVGVSINQLQAK
jgi:hypothetical protein